MLSFPQSHVIQSQNNHNIQKLHLAAVPHTRKMGEKIDNMMDAEFKAYMGSYSYECSIKIGSVRGAFPIQTGPNENVLHCKVH